MKSYYKRAFLNKPKFESVGLILAEAAMDGRDLSADLTIGDCTRQITLAFSVWRRGPRDEEYYDAREIANIRHKSAVLRQTVNDFLDRVEEGLVELEERDGSE